MAGPFLLLYSDTLFGTVSIATSSCINRSFAALTVRSTLTEAKLL